MSIAMSRVGAIIAGTGLVAALVPTAMATASNPASTPPEVDCSWTRSTVPLQDAFSRAADASGVPAEVLKAVSYLESRWDDHGARPSADGGYGPMNLTDLPPDNDSGKGDGARLDAASARTARQGATLTGLDLATIKGEADANICAGAAVLASYRSQRSVANDAAAESTSTRADVNTWQAAVARYGSGSKGFVRQVYTHLRSGESRVTAQGHSVTLAPQPQATIPAAPASSKRTDCPPTLGCEWLPAPYEKLDPTDPDTTGNYGNHDLADRTGKAGPQLKYIVIHDTEGSYNGSVALVQDPTYLAWNYTIRSADGHVAQHLDAKDVGWHAGNWYVNMHSIGIEHEGKGGNGGWYTEAMYQSSAELVKHLAKRYSIALDPQHVIGHDQVPGTVAGNTARMHWDPGPYWDWEHYFDLLGAPIGGGQAANAVSPGDVVTVRPGQAGNPQTLTQCEEQSPGSGPCQADAPTNFVPLHQAPSEAAPLAKDVAVHPSGAAGSTVVSDVAGRAQAGNRLVVKAVQEDWVQVSWAGELVWLHNPSSRRVLVRTPGATVTVKTGTTSAPAYGRAYPEQSAYPTTIPYQAVSPVEYTLKPGQSYALTDRTVVTDYFNAKTYDGTTPGDRTDVRGVDVYYQVALAHRVVYVRASDVDVHPARPTI